MTDWRAKEAANQAIFRAMNEWTAAARDARLVPERAMDTYLCECSDAGCTDAIDLTRIEYEAVRAVPVRFAIALNHEDPEVDSLNSENLRFASVEKFYGVGVQIARATDPRRKHMTAHPSST